jgi:hypothetical protein
VRLYPDVPAARASTLLRDAVVVAALVLFAWLAVGVHDAVDRLAVLGEGVRSGGEAVQGGFESAAEAVDGTPIVGDRIADGLRAAGGGTGGNAAGLGRRGEEAAHDLANLLGAITFGLPAALLLGWYLPGRVRQVRRLTSAALVLGDPLDPDRRRLLAMRAAFSLPYGQLLAHTRDPLGDLAAERYDALVEAALEDAGLRPR